MTIDVGRNGRAGVAIGPILFIIAIISILAAAIAAGSGTFAPATGNESNRTKASAILQIGENLKIGMDRITIENGASPLAVDLAPINATSSTSLFSPAGGGATIPSVAMANDPTKDAWYYVREPVAGFGSSATDMFAVLKVSSGVCAEINNRTTGNAIIPRPLDLGRFKSMTEAQTTSPMPWPTLVNAGINLAGVASGCVNNSNPASTGYYYYHMLAIQ